MFFNSKTFNTHSKNIEVLLLPYRTFVVAKESYFAGIAPPHPLASVRTCLVLHARLSVTHTTTLGAQGRGCGRRSPCGSAGPRCPAAVTLPPSLRVQCVAPLRPPPHGQ